MDRIIPTFMMLPRPGSKPDGSQAQRKVSGPAATTTEVKDVDQGAIAPREASVELPAAKGTTQAVRPGALGALAEYDDDKTSSSQEEHEALAPASPEHAAKTDVAGTTAVQKDVDTTMARTKAFKAFCHARLAGAVKTLERRSIQAALAEYEAATADFRAELEEELGFVAAGEMGVSHGASGDAHSDREHVANVLESSSPGKPEGEWVTTYPPTNMHAEAATRAFVPKKKSLSAVVEGSAFATASAELPPAQTTPTRKATVKSPRSLKGPPGLRAASVATSMDTTSGKRVFSLVNYTGNMDDYDPDTVIDYVQKEHPEDAKDILESLATEEGRASLATLIAELVFQQSQASSVPKAGKTADQLRSFADIEKSEDLFNEATTSDEEGASPHISDDDVPARASAIVRRRGRPAAHILQKVDEELKRIDEEMAQLADFSGLSRATLNSRLSPRFMRRSAKWPTFERFYKSKPQVFEAAWAGMSASEAWASFQQLDEHEEVLQDFRDLEALTVMESNSPQSRTKTFEKLVKKVEGYIRTCSQAADVEVAYVMAGSHHGDPFAIVETPLAKDFFMERALFHGDQAGQHLAAHVQNNASKKLVRLTHGHQAWGPIQEAFPKEPSRYLPADVPLKLFQSFFARAGLDRVKNVGGANVPWTTVLDTLKETRTTLKGWPYNVRTPDLTTSGKGFQGLSTGEILALITAGTANIDMFDFARVENKSLKVFPLIICEPVPQGDSHYPPTTVGKVHILHSDLTHTGPPFPLQKLFKQVYPDGWTAFTSRPSKPVVDKKKSTSQSTGKKAPPKSAPVVEDDSADESKELPASRPPSTVLPTAVKDRPVDEEDDEEVPDEAEDDVFDALTVKKRPAAAAAPRAQKKVTTRASRSATAVASDNNIEPEDSTEESAEDTKKPTGRPTRAAASASARSKKLAEAKAKAQAKRAEAKAKADAAKANAKAEKKVAGKATQEVKKRAAEPTTNESPQKVTRLSKDSDVSTGRKAVTFDAVVMPTRSASSTPNSPVKAAAAHAKTTPANAKATSSKPTGPPRAAKGIMKLEVPALPGHEFGLPDDDFDYDSIMSIVERSRNGDKIHKLELDHIRACIAAYPPTFRVPEALVEVVS